MSDKNENIPNYSREISPENSMDIIKSVYDTSKNALNNNSQTANKMNNKLWVVFGIVGVFVIICVTIFIYKRKNIKEGSK